MIWYVCPTDARLFGILNAIVRSLSSSIFALVRRNDD